MNSGSPSPSGRLFALIKRIVSFLIGPPGVGDDAKPITLAVPDARSTFDPGDVGPGRRPPARLRCPRCNTTFVQRFATDILRCPSCRFEREPSALSADLLLALECPSCGNDLDTGIRHPNLFSIPQWASCQDCHYHWEYSHDFR